VVEPHAVALIASVNLHALVSDLCERAIALGAMQGRGSRLLGLSLLAQLFDCLMLFAPEVFFFQRFLSVVPTITHSAFSIKA
jgi:hypothetical protein